MQKPQQVASNGHKPERRQVTTSRSHQDETRVIQRSPGEPTVVKPGWRMVGPAPQPQPPQGETQFPVHEGFTDIIHDMLQQPERDTHTRVRGTHLLVLLLLAITLVARLAAVEQNTLYLDEAIYATVGEDVRAGVFDQGATGWMFGSYLYPVLASAVNDVGGVFGMRVMSALLTTGAALLVFLAARRLFDMETGLWTLLLFGLSGVSISLGQQALLDALGVPLLALAFYWAVRGFRPGQRQGLYFALAGFAFSVSVLAKYIALLALPALVLFVMALHLAEGRSIVSLVTRVPWLSLFVPMMIVLGIYGAFYFNDLRNVMSGQYASQAADRGAILWQIIQDIGVSILLATAGMLMLTWKTLRRFYNEHRGRLLILLPLLGLLMLALLALPLYHLLAANERSLWKHNVYTLVLITPLAGYAVARTIQFLRSLGQTYAVPVRLGSAVITITALLLFMGSALRQNDAIQRSWPNNADEIAYLQTQQLTPDDRVLSPSYAIYEYYFDTGVEDRTLWNNVWYTEYGTATGTEAIRESIEECVYDLILLDNYYAPEWAGTLEPLVQQAGYVIAHSTMEQISSGDTIITNIYQLPESGTCQGAAES